MSIKAGAHHAAAITRSGRLWMWGSNKFGQLGVALAPKSSEGAGESVSSSNVISEPFDVTSTAAQTSLCGYKIRSAALGWRHTVALSHSQVAWAWGYSTAPRTNVDTAADGIDANEETLEEDLELELRIQSPEPIPMNSKMGRRCVQIGCAFSRTLSLTSATFRQDEFDVLSSVADRVLVKGQPSPQTHRRESVISRSIINQVVHPDEFHDYDTQKERPTKAMLSRRRISITASPVPRLAGSKLTQRADASPVKLQAAKTQRSPPKEILRQMNQRDLVELAMTLGRGKSRSGL